nr:hypothetical protein [Tanacetum cinerariifolium]
MMKLEYIYKGDGYVFVDYTWERELSIDNEIYPEWVLEFFSTLYFDNDVHRNNLMKEKCIWFRLCGHEHILTLPEFVVVLGLFTKDEVIKATKEEAMDWVVMITSAMPDFRGSSSRYVVGGSSREAGFKDDDDMDE